MEGARDVRQPYNPHGQWRVGPEGLHRPGRRTGPGFSASDAVFGYFRTMQAMRAMSAATQSAVVAPWRRRNQTSRNKGGEIMDGFAHPHAALAFIE